MGVNDFDVMLMVSVDKTFNTPPDNFWTVVLVYWAAVMVTVPEMDTWSSFPKTMEVIFSLLAANVKDAPTAFDTAATALYWVVLMVLFPCTNNVFKLGNVSPDALPLMVPTKVAPLLFVMDFPFNLSLIHI